MKGKEFLNVVKNLADSLMGRQTQKMLKNGQVEVWFRGPTCGEAIRNYEKEMERTGQPVNTPNIVDYMTSKPGRGVVFTEDGRLIADRVTKFNDVWRYLTEYDSVDFRKDFDDGSTYTLKLGLTEGEVKVTTHTSGHN